jgi:hypothetical protein
MNTQLATKPDTNRCPICLQTETNCVYFKRMRFELLCFEFWLMLRNLVQQSPLKALSAEQLSQLLPMARLLQAIERESPRVPEHYHKDHVPAHWLQEPKTGGGTLPLPEKVDLSLMWQLQLNRHSALARSFSSPFLRASRQARFSHQSSPRRLLTPTRPHRVANPIAQAVLRHFPRSAPTYTPPVCSITLEVPKHPGRVVPCGHTFAFHAIEEWAGQHPPGEAPCPNCRGRIEKIEQICLPLPVDHRRLHESVYLLWMSHLPQARPVPTPRSQEPEITRWLLRHSLFFANPGTQDIMRQRGMRP